MKTLYDWFLYKKQELGWRSKYRKARFIWRHPRRRWLSVSQAEKPAQFLPSALRRNQLCKHLNLILDFLLLELPDNSFCCLSHPTWGTLLWHSEPTNTIVLLTVINWSSREAIGDVSILGEGKIRKCATFTQSSSMKTGSQQLCPKLKNEAEF
jgi:hypothetical protein